MERKPSVFSDSEIAEIRESIARLRHPGAYEQGKWMVSYLNRADKVVGTGVPSQVRLRDIALRTTEQMPGVVRTEGERRSLLRAIVEARVPEVMLSNFSRGHTPEEMKAEVALAKSINPDCRLVYGETRSKDDIRLAADTGYDIVQYWATPWIESAPMYSGGAFRLAWNGEDWRARDFPRTFAEQTDRVCELIEYGKSLGVAVSAGINLLAFAAEEYVENYCKSVAAARPHEIMLYDGSSGVGPEAYNYLVRLARECSGDVPIGIHPHNMFDLGTACATSAVRAGVTTIEVAINRYCSAAGQADLASTSVALEAMYGVETGVDLSKLTSLARHAEEFTGYKVAWNHPITGREVFNWGGGERVVQQLGIDQLIHWCIEPTMVGNERKWTITRDSGPLTMWDKMTELGLPTSHDVVDATLADALKLIRDQRSPITDAQLIEIAQRHAQAMAALEDA
jgi:isopropylmalate/homocitrate/citramalate synthase